MSLKDWLPTFPDPEPKPERYRVTVNFKDDGGSVAYKGLRWHEYGTKDGFFYARNVERLIYIPAWQIDHVVVDREDGEPL